MFLKRVLSILLTVGILMSTITGFAVSVDSTTVDEPDVIEMSDYEGYPEGDFLESIRLEATSGEISGNSIT